MGRYDADFGTMLMNKGNGNFACENINGLVIKEQVRRIKQLNIADQKAYILAKNNDSIMVISFSYIY